ncbi:uncharacterized protein LOC119658093 [Hermetia illucens]|nr:uncharacterized protein LOC119658093 [Hermetia illucens]
MAVDHRLGYLQKDILDEVMAEIDYNPRYLNHDDGLEVKGLRRNNIILVDSYEAFRTMLHQLEITHVYYSSGYYLIVLLNNVENNFPTIERILVDCSRLALIHVNILVESKQATADFYTYYPYTQFSCNDTRPKLVHSFVNETMILGVDIFPNKVINLHKCPLRVITWVNPPFILMENQSDGSVRFYGDEGILLEQLAMKFNFSIKYVSAPAENPRGFIFDNGSMTGTFEIMRRGNADFTIGCFRYSEQRAKHFATTYSYYQVPIVVSIPHGLSYTALERLFYPFSDAVWLGVLLISISAVLVIVLLKYFIKRHAEFFIMGSNNKTPIYNMLISALGGQVNHPPKHTFARYILMKWLILALVLRSTYQAVLYDFIRTNTEKKLPDSLEELVDAGYTIHVDPPTKDIAQSNRGLRNIYEISVESQHAFLLRLQGGLQKRGILCPRDYVTYFNNVHYKDGPLHILKERILVQPNCIYFQKYSFFVRPFNDIIRRFWSGGLLDKWKDDFTKPKYTFDGSRPSVRRFSNEQLAGAYELYGALIGVAFVIFMLELLSTYFEQARIFFEIIIR